MSRDKKGFGPCCPCCEGRHQDCILGPCECGCGRPEPQGTIVYETTSRGFATGCFTDKYGLGCSVQDSSVATEHCLWLGTDKPAIKTGPPWEEFLLPEGVSVFSRMHLTISMARALRDALDRFIETGSCEP